MVRVVVLVLLGLSLLVLARPDLAGLDADLPERDDLRLWIDAAGLLGPLLVVALMTLAIVASPLPSAPIALAAGAAYGHTYGTLLVVLGAEIGALAAFLLARGLGRPFRPLCGLARPPHSKEGDLTWPLIHMRDICRRRENLWSYPPG